MGTGSTGTNLLQLPPLLNAAGVFARAKPRASVLSQTPITPTCTAGHSSSTRCSCLFRVKTDVAFGWV